MADEMDKCKNQIQIIGALKNKRFNQTAKGISYLNLYINTKTERGSFFSIGVTFWDKLAKELNEQIEIILPDIEDGDPIDLNNTIFLKVAGELRENVWMNNKKVEVKQMQITGKKYKIVD